MHMSEVGRVPIHSVCGRSKYLGDRETPTSVVEVLDRRPACPGVALHLVWLTCEVYTQHQCIESTTGADDRPGCKCMVLVTALLHWPCVDPKSINVDRHPLLVSGRSMIA